MKRFYAITLLLSGHWGLMDNAHSYTMHQKDSASSENTPVSNYEFYDRSPSSAESQLFLSDLKIESAQLSTENAHNGCTLSPCPPLYYDFNALTQPNVALSTDDIKHNLNITNQILGKCGILAGKVNIFSGTLKNNPKSALSNGGNEGAHFVQSNRLGKVLKGINTAYLNDTGRNNLGYTMVQSTNGAPAEGVNFAQYKEFIERYGEKAILYVAKSSSIISSLFQTIVQWFQKNPDIFAEYGLAHFGPDLLASNKTSSQGKKLHHSFAYPRGALGKKSDGSYWTFVNGPEDKNEDRTTTAHEILHALGVPHCGFEGEPCSRDNVMNSGTNNQIAISPKQCQTAREIGQKMGVLKSNP